MAPISTHLIPDLPPLYETPDLPGAQIPVPQGHWCSVSPSGRPFALDQVAPDAQLAQDGDPASSGLTDLADAPRMPLLAAAVLA